MIKNEYVDYLSGASFEPRKSFTFELDGGSLYREDLIVKIVNGASVLHVGFCDHLAHLDEKMENDTWTHAIIGRAASKIYGVDINNDAVEHLRSKGISDIYCCDITNSLPSELESIIRFDYLILGEVLEHIPNPQKFLADIKKVLGSRIGKIIITCPNAFSFSNCLFSMFGIERINTDHRFWFSPFTLSKIATDAGYFVEKVSTTQLCRPASALGILSNLLVRAIPGKRDTLVLICNANAPTKSENV
jgi:hypothetical protein